MIRIVSTMAVILTLSTSAHAKPGLSVLPSGQVFPTPVGILFPAFTSAGGTNAAAITLAGKNSAIQGAYVSTGTPGLHGAFASGATSTRNFGVNGGYLGSFSNGTSTHGGFAGAGATFDPISVGIGLRDFDLSDSTNPGVDVGLIAGQGKGLTFGFVMYNVNGSTQLDAGIGFGGGKKFNVEFNLLLPPFNSGGSSYAALVFQGNITPGDIFGFHFRSVHWNGGSYQHTLGVSIWLKDSLNVFGQFTTSHTWTGGLTLAF